MRTVLIVLAVLLVVGLLPAWPYSTNWGFYPSGGALLIALLAIVLLLPRRGDVL